MYLSILRFWQLKVLVFSSDKQLRAAFITVTVVTVFFFFNLQVVEQGVAKPSARATVKSTFMSTVAKPTKNDDSEPEPEDYDPPPPKASLGDFLAQAKMTGNSNKKGKKFKGKTISLTRSDRPMDP